MRRSFIASSGGWPGFMFVLLVIAASKNCINGGEPMRIQPGVPLELAELRRDQISDLAYELEFQIPEESDQPIEGKETIRFELTRTDLPVVVDFRQEAESVLSVGRDGSNIPFRFEQGHIVLPASELETGSNEITIRFRAGDESLNRRSEYLYALFVPDRASLAFPCFDQPDLKARFELTLEVPKGWQAVSNGSEVTRGSNHNRDRIQFAPTQPISTYLFSFTAGIFDSVVSSVSGRAMTMFHRESDDQKVDRNIEAIFDLHEGALDWLEEYTAIEYPFEKFDFVLIPDFQFGGMEHPGAIFYRASSLFLDESATQSQHLNRARLIAHETSHMWFGDLVTMKWFNDVWTKEVFANFMAAKIVNPAFPEIDHRLRFLLSHFPAAYSVDRTPGTHAIRQPLENMNDASSLYGAIIYQKAPVVMQHLEAQIGEEAFRDGMREYLSEFRFKNATWVDLIEILNRQSPDDLSSWSQRWVEEAARPEIETRLELSENGSIESLAFTQKDPLGMGRHWVQELPVLISYPDGTRRFSLNLTETTVPLSEAEGLPAPLFVLPNGDGTAYGLFRQDETSRNYFLDALPLVKDELVRAVVWVNLWEELLDGLVTPERLLDLILRSLPQEPNQQIRELTLSYLRNIYWKYLPESTRTQNSGKIEGLLQALMRSTPEEGSKSAYFRTLRSTATTPEARKFLLEIWRMEATVPGLTLSEADMTTLALELAVREVPDWDEILSEQGRRIQNQERKERLEFVRPALSADPEVRDRFFNSLSELENRTKERWVLEALNYLHHPLRADQSEKYILPSLELLGEIKRTGDIFFPKAWLDATLGNYQSETAARTVQTFLQNCDYPPRLTGKLLQSADDLFRAAKIVEDQ